MNKNIKGYILTCGGTKYPIGIETSLTDIDGKHLSTGDTVSLEHGSKTVVCTARGDIMGIWGGNQGVINDFKVKKIKSYKDLKNGEEFEGYNLKVVLGNTNQNHVENIKYIINGNTSVVILEDGSKGIAKCHPNDEFDKKEGLIRAYARANGEEIDNEQKFKLKEPKKSFTIYYIEHKPNEKQYKFRSNERLNINDFVICDTKFGKAYGKVVSYEEEMLTEKESEQYKECWKV